MENFPHHHRHHRQLSNKYIILALIISVFLGYARELMPYGETVGFVYNSIRIDSQWYWFVLFKDLRSVILVWLAWHLIPWEQKLLKIAASIFATMITMVPINFILFYSAPFHSPAFILKIVVSLLVGYILYFNDGIWRNNTRSDNS